MDEEDSGLFNEVCNMPARQQYCKGFFTMGFQANSTNKRCNRGVFICDQCVGMVPNLLSTECHVIVGIAY
jgi:hypothetical protein